MMCWYDRYESGRENNQGLEGVLELMHHIQSRLPVKEAARTSVLSKSWLHVWSTVPNLKFQVPKKQEREHMKLVYVDRTLLRYLQNNLPIESFELEIDIKDHESASLAEKWIRSVATKTCLKELSLKIRLHGASLHLPDEILSGENLTKMRVSVPLRRNHSVWMTTTHHPKCMSLQELHLDRVRLSEDVLHGILSSCRLLAKIELIKCSQGLKTIKVNNQPCLYHLDIYTNDGGSTALEISHVPKIRLFTCDTDIPGNTHSISLGRSVTELTLGGGVITDNASLDMIIKSGLPFLESLTLDMRCWMLGSFHFKCASMKRFSLLACPRRLFDVVHVKAPKLLFFFFSGNTMPNLLFPDSTLEQIEFQLKLKIGRHLNASFFLKIREALTLSSKCDVHITAAFNYGPPLHIDIDDLRTRLPVPPAVNVQSLSFETNRDKCLWERSPFFDAFFEICHPHRISTRPDLVFIRKNHFCKLMLMEVLEKNKNNTTTTSYWPRYLKHVEIIRPDNQTRETLTDSHTGFLDGQDRNVVEFILNWC